MTGPVPEVLPYFAASDAGLNLVTRGSGSNVKLFEYLAAQIAGNLHRLWGTGHAN